MTVFSPPQLAGLLREAGWPPAEIPLAVAVILAESGGDSSKVGDRHLTNTTWGPSVGLFQIRSLHSEKGTGRTRDELVNSDPRINVRHALEIRRGQGWRAWTVYNTGDYREFERAGMDAAGRPEIPAVVGRIVDLASPADEVWDAAQSGIRVAQTAVGYLEGVRVWVADRHNWVRVGWVVGGTVLLYAALLIASRGPVTKAVQPVVQLVSGGKNAAVGAAAKVAEGAA